MPKTQTAETEPEFMPDVLRIADAALHHKAQDLRAYDVRGLTLIADAFVLCSASSEPQLKAIFSNVRKEMREVGRKALHAEGQPGDGWLVLDFGTVIFHVFKEEQRGFYDLDTLWGDAPEIALDLDDA